MRLTRLFTVTAVVLLTLIGLMLASAVTGEWRTYAASREGLAVMRLAYQAMIAAEKVSADAGRPMGAGRCTPPDPAKGERLRKAREASDAALQDVAGALRGMGGFRSAARSR
jgi:hypothetical protein